MADKLRVVYRTGAAHKAHLLKNILADYEINSHVADLNVATELGPNILAIEVRVHEQDLELATRIADAFDRHVAGQREDDPEDELDHADVPRLWIDWPKCKRCQAVRETSCPYCSTISSSFELADQDWSEDHLDESGEPAYPLLLCRTCSEPFEPKFYRLCAHCNLDLGHGEPPPELELRTATGLLSPAIFGWLLIAIAILILLMVSTT